MPGEEHADGALSTDATRRGMLVAAVHHRVVSGTSWSTTDSKFFKWIRKFGEELEENDFDGLYRQGDPVGK